MPIRYHRERDQPMRNKVAHLFLFAFLVQCSEGQPQQAADRLGSTGQADGDRVFLQNKENKRQREERSATIPQTCDSHIGKDGKLYVHPDEVMIVSVPTVYNFGARAEQIASGTFVGKDAGKLGARFYEERDEIASSAGSASRRKDINALVKSFNAATALAKAIRTSDLVDRYYKLPINSLEMQAADLALQIAYLKYSSDKRIDDFVSLVGPIIDQADARSLAYRYRERNSPTALGRTNAPHATNLSAIWAVVLYRLSSGDEKASRNAFLYGLAEDARFHQDASYAPYDASELIALLQTTDLSLEDLLYRRPYPRSSKERCSDFVAIYVHWLDLSSRIAVENNNAERMRNIKSDIDRLESEASTRLIGLRTQRVISNIQHRLNMKKRSSDHAG